jgi:hypothetical protein
MRQAVAAMSPNYNQINRLNSSGLRAENDNLPFMLGWIRTLKLIPARARQIKSHDRLPFESSSTPPHQELSKGGAIDGAARAEAGGLKNPRICRSYSCHPSLAKTPSSEEVDLCYSGHSLPVAEGAIHRKPPPIPFTFHVSPIRHCGTGLAQHPL